MDINITLLLQVIAFLVLIVLIRRFLWGPMVQAMEARQKKIEEGLMAAESGREEFEKAEEKAREILAEAKKEAQKLLDVSHKRETEIVEAAKLSAVEEAKKIRANAELAIEQQVIAAKEALRKEVGALVMAGAEKVLARELNAKNHSDIIDDVSKQLVQ